MVFTSALARPSGSSAFSSENWSASASAIRVIEAVNGVASNATTVMMIEITGINDPVQLIDPEDPLTDPGNPDYPVTNPPVIDPAGLLPDPLEAEDGSPFTPFDASVFFGDAEDDTIVYTATGLPE